MVTDGTLLKVYAWYDNEVGYACRMVDLANIVLRRGGVMPWLPQLPDRHRVLLGLHAGRRRACACWCCCISSSSATRRSRWPSCSCSTRPPASSPISAAAGWRRASAFRACWRSARSLQIAGLLMLSALDPGWSAAGVGRLGGDRAGHRRRRQGRHQDRVEVGDQGDVGRRQRPTVPLGRLVHRLEERDEGHRLLRRRPAARCRGLHAARCG